MYPGIRSKKKIDIKMETVRSSIPLNTNQLIKITILKNVD